MRYGPLGPELVMLRDDATGYRAMAELRRSGRTMHTGGSADLHLRYQLDQMRAESQAFDRDNGIYKGMITRVIDVMLGGEGLTLQVKTDDKRLNSQAEELWSDWWESPEVRGLDDGPAVERLLLRHLFVDGDVGVIKDDKLGLIQVIEAERISSRETTAGDNRIEMGVELTKIGRPLAYWVDDYGDYGQLEQDSQRKLAGDFLFMAHRERASQTRGAPVQQSNFAMFHRINDICDSEAVAWQLLSRIALAVTRKDGSAIGEALSTADSDAEDTDAASRYQDFGEGIVFWANPGEEVKGIERNIPGANFVESLKMFMRLLGLPFGFSLEFVLLIWSDTNYSSGRASIKQVERAVQPWIKLLTRRMMTPLYLWQLSRWIGKGKITDHDDLRRHSWHAPRYPFLDPDKEERAAERRLQTGRSSPTRESKEGGTDDDELVAEQEADLRKRLEAVERLNEEFEGAGITVADFTGFVERRKPKAMERSDGSG